MFDKYTTEKYIARARIITIILLYFCINYKYDNINIRILFGFGFTLMSMKSNHCRDSKRNYYAIMMPLKVYYAVINITIFTNF